MYMNPLHIIWDLDYTILASHSLPKCNDKYSIKIYPDYFDQIDDDYPFQDNIPNTRTWFRQYAKLVINILSYMCYQHIFTSAQETYTCNILKALKEQTGNEYFKIIKHRDLYPPLFLRNGKSIFEIINGLTNNKNKRLLLAKRTLLFDDQIRYLRLYPYNGILVKPYKDVLTTYQDYEMIKIFILIIICHMFSDVRLVVKNLRNHGFLRSLKVVSSK